MLGFSCFLSTQSLEWHAYTGEDIIIIDILVLLEYNLVILLLLLLFL